MTEIATRSAGALAVQPAQTDWTPDQRAALRQLGLDNVDRGVMLQFLTTCQRTGLDPWSRQIYLLPLSGGFQTFTAIDGYRVIAKRSDRYRGQTAPEWCGEDGIWHDVWLSRERPPAAARVGVLHADYDAPLYAVALFEEYVARTAAGTPNAMWRKMPANQLAKCAEALALRKAFPNDMAGLLTAEEMEQAGPRYQTGQQPPTPVSPPRSVEKLIADAETADEDGLRVLWREAAAQRQLEIVVTDKTTGEVVPLRSYLERCVERLQPRPPDQPGATSEPDPVSADTPAASGDSGAADPWAATDS